MKNNKKEENDSCYQICNLSSKINLDVNNSNQIKDWIKENTNKEPK